MFYLPTEMSPEIFSYEFYFIISILNTIIKLNSRSHHKVPSIVSRYNIILLPTENFFVATCNQGRDNVCSQSQ